MTLLSLRCGDSARLPHGAPASKTEFQSRLAKAAGSEKARCGFCDKVACICRL